MLTIEELQTALLKKVPTGFVEKVSELAALLSATANKTMPVVEVQKRISAIPEFMPLLEALGGQKIVGEGIPSLSFGEHNTFGNIEIGDLAGGNIIKLYLTFPIYQTLTTIARSAPPDHREKILGMVNYYQTVFGGRETELQELDEFLEQNEKSVALILEPTGRGKTALAIHWVARVKTHRPDWTIVFAPISIRYQTATEAATYSILANCLATFYGEKEKLLEYDISLDNLRALVNEYLHREPPEGKKLLVVLDGLDEATSWSISPGLLPGNPPSGVHILTLARQVANKSRATWLLELGWEARLTADITLPLLNQSKIENVLSQMGNPLDILSRDNKLLKQISRISQGDPLTIRLLIEYLRDHPEKEVVLENIGEGLEAFMGNWLDELLEKSTTEKDSVYTLLSLCTIALGPMTGDDIQELEPVVFKKKASLIQSANELRRFIIGNGSAESGYVLSHPRLREWYGKKLGEKELKEFRLDFVRYGKEWYENRSKLSPYLRQYWVTHLKEAGEWKVAQKALTEVEEINGGYRQPWAAARYAAEGSYTGYLADLEMLWRWAEEQQELGLGFRCALITSSIRSLSGNLSPDLLVALVKIGTLEGKWKGAVALEHIRYKQDEKVKAEAIIKLVESGCELSYEQVIEITREIKDQNSRLAVWVKLIPEVGEEQRSEVVEEALHATNEIKSEETRTNVLINLVQYLPEAQMPQALQVAKAIRDELRRAKVLTRLAGVLPATQQDVVLEEELNSARTIKDEGRRVEILSRLAQYLPEAMLPQALEFARTIRDEWRRAKVLTNLAQYLPEAMLPQAFEFARTIRDYGERAYALTSLAQYLPAAQQGEVVEEALHIARKIGSDWKRAKVLTSLAGVLPAAQQGEVVEEVLHSVRKINGDYKRADAISRLAQYGGPLCQDSGIRVFKVDNSPF